MGCAQKLVAGLKCLAARSENPKRERKTVLKALAVVLGLILPFSAQALTITVVGLGIGHADVLIDGRTPRSLRTGQFSPEGVRLLKANGQAALFQVKENTYSLGLGQTSNPYTVVLKADRMGQFSAQVMVNGVPTQALVDTGAAAVTLNQVEAQRMGIDYRRGKPVRSLTANGVGNAYLVDLSSVRVGDIQLRNIKGVVVDGGPEKLHKTLLGMSFLNYLEMRRSGNTLTLVRR